jgi:hypothetical protein
MYFKRQLKVKAEFSKLRHVAWEGIFRYCYFNTLSVYIFVESPLLKDIVSAVCIRQGSKIDYFMTVELICKKRETDINGYPKFLDSVI